MEQETPTIRQMAEQEFERQMDECHWTPEQKKESRKVFNGIIENYVRFGQAVAARVEQEITERINALPRYQEYDVVRRSSMDEYLNLEQVEEVIQSAAAREESK